MLELLMICVIIFVLCLGVIGLTIIVSRYDAPLTLPTNISPVCNESLEQIKNIQMHDFWRSVTK